MLVQFKVAETDPIYGLIEKLTEEGKSQKGYVAEQIRLRLRVMQTIAEIVGEEDPLKLLGMLSGYHYQVNSAIRYEKPLEIEELNDEELNSEGEEELPSDLLLTVSNLSFQLQNRLSKESED